MLSKNPVFYLLIFSLLMGLNAFTQADSVLMLNGKVYKGEIGDTDHGNISMTMTNKKGKSAVKIIDEFRVFSYVKSGQQKISYYQDELSGNFLTVPEAQAAAYGSYDARFTFKPRIAFWSSVLLGFGSTLFDTYLSQKAVNDPNTIYTTPGFFKKPPSVFPLLVPPMLTAIWAIPKGRVRYKHMLHHNYQGNPDYYRGYIRIARQKRMLAALRGSAIGVATGLLTYYIVR